LLPIGRKMAKGELSREFIIESSVGIFNTKGYIGTSLQQVMDKTGFTKGGIYRHFTNKEELAAAAFSLAYKQMKQAYAGTFDSADAADVKLIKFLTRMKTFMLQPPVKGGCPILNSSTEVDDTNEPLRKLVKAAAMDWEGIMIKIYEEGRQQKIFSKTLDAVKEARFLMATIEGAIMLCKLHRDVEYGLYTADILIDRVKQLKQ
jgi:TetR/AcrR family transcriptional regulator, transcriptional repressor for nem operon